MQVLIVSPPGRPLPEGTTDALVELGWDVATASDYRTALRAVGEKPIDAVIVSAPGAMPGGDGDAGDFEALRGLLKTRRIAGVIVTDAPTDGPDDDSGSLIGVVGRDVAVAELRGRLAMIERYHATVKRMELELANTQRLGKQLNLHVKEMDDEMRLAGRLQRDFLPPLSGTIGNLGFAALYHPASWVSGDIFDVFRVDQNHTGFYIADAVGHGVAAGLLTMFIKRSFTPKRIECGGYSIVSPSEALRTVNEALVAQSLPRCQFVTAVYGLFDHRTNTLSCACGGHPAPVLIREGGVLTDLSIPGGLLGIFDKEEFPTVETQLSVCDKLLLFTDGVELAFGGDGAARVDEPPFHSMVRSIVDRPIEEIIASLQAGLYRDDDPFRARDDVTIVGLEVLA